MRSLAELLASPEGRSFLGSRGVMLDATRFVQRLRPPADGGLTDLLGLRAGSRPVYVAHQIHIDFRRSVVSKFRAALDLRGASTEPVMLWLDTDRVGSDRASTTIAWPLPDGEDSFRLAPQRLKNLEPRFVPVERDRLEEAVTRLRAWIDSTVADPQRRDDAFARLERLASALLRDEPTTLARANLAFASSLLSEHLGFGPPSAFVSTLASRSLLSRGLNDLLGVIDDVILVFNTSVDELIASDVDPQVHPLADDYLPLHYACDGCGARRRLGHERSGADHFAVMTCSCGTSHRFHLGSPAVSLGELEGTERWSTDVTLPVYLNDLASGVVAGRSSALYGLVLGEVAEKVLGRSAIPVLVPEDLAGGSGELGPVDSLLYEYLAGA